jgi:hypothetical protein
VRRPDAKEAALRGEPSSNTFLQLHTVSPEPS